VRLARLVHLVNLSLVLSVLPAVARAEEPAPPAGSVQKLFERELGPLPLVAFASPAGVKGKVEAVAAVEIADEENAERLTIRLGAEQPVVCTLGRTRYDAGASITGLVETVGKKLEVVGAQPVEVSVEDGKVVLFADVLYHQQTEQGTLAGHFKLAVHPHGTHSLLCFHDEPGYSATFRRVVKGLAASLSSEAPDDRDRARFAEVLVTEVAGRPIGYVERAIWEKAGGGRVAITWEAMVLPRSPKDLMGIDEYTLEESDAAGLITRVQTVHALNGELDLDVRLEPGAAPRTFAYKGQKAGKAIEGTFRAREGLASELWFARRLAARGKPALKLVHDTYAAGADPAAPTRLTYARAPKDRERASLTVGPMTVEGALDEHGLMKDLEIPMGPAVMTMKRVWSRGSP
jgi:hypothetical protein